MNRRTFRWCQITAVAAVAFVFTLGNSLAEDAATVRALFADPPRGYATAPLWVWNDMLTEDQIRSTLQDLAGQKVKQAFVHPRPGLMTPYLSEDWFRLWRVALDEAKRLDMNIWIYDENSYPSGFAGGLVPEAMPESRGRALHLAEVPQPGPWNDETYAVYRLTGDGYENVTQQAREGEALPEAKYQVATWRLAPEGGWFGGKYYVDLLKPGVTEKFIEITFERYKRELGQHFGKRIPGIFTDEPHPSTHGLPWNEHLADEFHKRWGYRLEEHLPALDRPIGNWKKVRHNYYQVMLEQFIEHWGKPCHDFCESSGIEFTGHYWEHGWPSTGHGPDNMAMYAWHQRPAIDCLMNRYDEGPNAQFGNLRAVKELSSVANQLNRKRTLCEAYGAGGWDLRFEDMKRIGDWLYVLGVNTMDEHLSYITIRGARKRDHPQSFSYHTPWWQDYHVMAAYFSRLSAALSAGHEINGVLVIEPTTTAWMYQRDGKRLGEIGNGFQKLVTDLAKAQIEFDLGCEDIIARHGKVCDLVEVDGSPGPAEFVVGHAAYHTVVLPPHMENLNAPVMKLLVDFALRGGRVLCCGKTPSLVDGVSSGLGESAERGNDWKWVAPADLPRELQSPLWKRRSSRNVISDNRGVLLHHRRQLADGQLLFLVNTSIEHSASGTVKSAGQVERWDPATGEVHPFPLGDGKPDSWTSVKLPPCGSLLLFFPNVRREPLPTQQKRKQTILPAGPTEVRRLEPNVLTLDYVDITIGGETRENLHFYRANQMAFQNNGMERNPWDSAVQLHDQLITRKFPAESGFEATYRFDIDGAVPQPLEIVIERPDLYAISCNGKPITATADAWWLDKAFGRIDITAAAKVGKNAVTIKARPMTIYHELEPAYLLGDFCLKSVEKGFVIEPSRPLVIADRTDTKDGSSGEGGETSLGWNRQGHPFYGAGVAYTEEFDVPQPNGTYRVRLPAWYGSVARVAVNGKPAGHIAWQPWECDVTKLIRSGTNTIEVTVIGTLKNTLGPHHAGEMRGAAWPHAFRQGPEYGPPPGQKYDTIKYGLFEPFVLVSSTP